MRTVYQGIPLSTFLMPKPSNFQSTGTWLESKEVPLVLFQWLHIVRGEHMPNIEPRLVQTREEWLLRMIGALRPAFHDIGHPIPNHVGVTCGWPSKRAFSKTHRVIGECWHQTASADNAIEIFISPCLGESIEAAETLIHELVHASGWKGHRGTFPRVAKAVGLIQPWRSTKAAPELQERLHALISIIGPYPHATLDRSKMPHKKDTTRMQKVACGTCGYAIRTTAKWIAVGLPICPCGTTMSLGSSGPALEG
jgi:hypothetical protein